MTEEVRGSALQKRESTFIALMRVIMITLLVFHHLFEIPGSGFFPRSSLAFDDLDVASTLNSFVHWLGMSAVPGLSLISGFLFFIKGPPAFTSLLRRRFQTIVLPSIAWTTLWLLVGFILYSAGKKFGVFGWMNYGFEEFEVKTLVNGIVGWDREPFAYQFWFIHDLVLTLILSPLIYLAITKFRIIFVVLMAGIWFMDLVPFPFFSGNILFFFSLGAYIAVHGISIERIFLAIKPMSGISYSLLILLILGRMFHDIHPWLSTYQYLCLVRIAGVTAFFIIVYTMADSIEKESNWLLRISPYSFFIFAVHYPLIEILKNLFIRIPYQSIWPGQLLTFIIVPLVTIGICLGMALVLKNVSKRTYSFLSGYKRI